MLLNPGRGPHSKAESQQANPPHPKGLHHGRDAEPRPQTDPEQGKKGGTSLDIDFEEALPEYDRFFVYWDEEAQQYRHVEKHRETFTVALLEDSDADPLVAGQDYRVLIDHGTEIGTWGKITHVRVAADCTATKVHIVRDCQTTDSILHLGISLASDIDAGTYGSAVELELEVTLEGFFFTAGNGGDATAEAHKFEGLWADFVNVTGDTMTGAILWTLAAATDKAVRSKVNGDSDDRFYLQADGKAWWGPGNAAQDTNLYRSAANILGTDDDFAILVAGKGLKIKEGANAKMGTAVLVGGAVTVSTTAVTASSRIFLTRQVVGGTQGHLSIGTVTAGTSFVINSSDGADTSTIAWLIVEPA